MLDLREHFGIWDHCRGTRFFKKQNPWSEIYLNPLDGLLVAARRSALETEDPRYELVVRNAEKADEDEVRKAFAANQPWVKRAVEKFFYLQKMGWLLGTIKEYTGRHPLPGDPDLGYFLQFYKSGGRRYREEGGTGDVENMLEEALEAILRTLNSMTGITVDYGRNLSQADLDEALAERGILECV